MKRQQAGFTIVELMIALSVLSTILVIATVIIIQIGALYSKGVNSSSLQNATRTVVGDITSAIQFSGQPPNPSPTCTPKNCYYGSLNATTPNGDNVQVYSFCINTTRYSYVLNRESGTDGFNNQQTPHVLWRDTMNTPANCNALNIVQAGGTPADSATVAGSGFDLAPKHTRLTRWFIRLV